MDVRNKTVVVTGGGRGIGRSIALRLARYGIRVATVAPGFTQTDILASMRPEMLDRLTAPVPLKRPATPEEIAHAVIFIFENDYFTGRCLDVDGGLRL
jgi:3-oxoacyl-[acyl-carrier protein] reductase